LIKSFYLQADNDGVGAAFGIATVFHVIYEQFADDFRGPSLWNVRKERGRQTDPKIWDMGYTERGEIERSTNGIYGN